MRRVEQPEPGRWAWRIATVLSLALAGALLAIGLLLLLGGPADAGGGVVEQTVAQSGPAIVGGEWDVVIFGRQISPWWFLTVIGAPAFWFLWREIRSNRALVVDLLKTMAGRRRDGGGRHE